MRYKIDLDGYIISVAFGCYLNDCMEYTGTIPTGYNSLADWATYACINAYFIDSNGNLAYDAERERLLKEKEAQDATDNAVLKRKDLYESEAVLDSQYIKATATGEVIQLEDIRPISPLVRITGVDPSYKKMAVYAHGINMMPNNARNETISGVTFSKAYSGAITVSGVPTANIEYTVAGSASNTVPLFALKKNHNYYLNLGGLECELRYYDGETTKQQYVGPSGLLNLPESIEVTQVVVKIHYSKPVYPSETLYPSDTLCPGGSGPIDTTFLPQLEYGTAYTSYEPYKLKSLNMDFSEFVDDGDTIDYIQIENGVVYISVGGFVYAIGSGNVGLYSDFNTIYATKDTTLEITYSTNVYDVDSLEFLQGKATTTNKFKILKDGSIEATNGYFSGSIESSSAKITGGNINIKSDGSNNDITLSYTHGSNKAEIGFNGNWLRGYLNGSRAFLINVGAIDGSPSAVFDGSLQSFGNMHSFGNLGASGDMTVSGSLNVYGEKNRVVLTKEHGAVCMNAYETACALFGDVGCGKTDETGQCYVYFDPVFLETVSTYMEYQVFLQKEGPGDLWVAEKTPEYFLVKGTDNLSFSWEAKAKQRGYENTRLKTIDRKENV